jgi:hypothetical protein
MQFLGAYSNRQRPYTNYVVLPQERTSPKRLILTETPQSGALGRVQDWSAEIGTAP